TGQVIELPRGSTPLDFAYEISEALGNHCSKAKVNGKVVPLDYQLQNGDRVYVVRNLEVSPNLYWLSLAHTEKARSAIRQSLLEQVEDTVLDQGVRMVNRQLRRFGHSALDNKYLLLSQYQQKDLNLEKRREFLIAIGKGELSAAEVVRDLLSSSERTKKGEDAPAPLKEVQHGSISVGGETGFKTKLSACCNPDLGTPIQGYVTRGGFISIHSRSCKVLSSLDPHRFIDVWWDGHQELSQDIRVEVVVSLANLLTSLSERLKERHIALNSFYHTRHEYGYALLFDLTVDRGQNITELLDSWKALDGVVSVRMLQVGEEVY
ncbi:MAG: TGS domain-containing protein, partial [Candidatus Gracilibacteria bacterium]|nr:TGS domain-containing protein [Candidatus Gracilibacteria bacterium]